MSPKHHPNLFDETIAWRRSSKCTLGSCVEVAITPTTVFVRDTKQCDLDDQPIVAIDRAAWPEFVDAIEHNYTEINVDGIAVALSETGLATVVDTQRSTALQFDRDEWNAFLGGAIDGEFS